MKFTYLYIIILILSLVTIASAAVPVASFTSNVTTGTTYPLVVWFNDTSTNAPQVWNWSFGDGRWFNTTNAALKNTTYQYSVAGKYAVSLLVNNTDGSDTKTVADYINLTSDNDDNLLIWLHMNGIEGSTVFTGEKGVAWTTMGAAHICTITYVFGGASGNFTGAKSYIYTPSTPILNFSTGAGEIEMWVKPMSSGSGVSLIKRGNPAQTAGWGVYHSTSAADSSGWVFWMGDQVTGATNTFTLPIGSWSHLVLSADPLGNNKVYVNGTLVATKSGMTANYDTNNPIYIGYRSSPVKYFDGYIDELRASKIERWKANFTPPYAQYAGVLETIYPDINPNSTFRYKTNPGDVAYLDNITPRNRTVQIQNITNTSYVLGSVTWNALIGYVKSVQLNLTYYPTGMTLVSSSIDNTLGVITFNISKPTGFSPGTDRASILDYTVIYYNYTDMSSIMPAMAFGYGYLINSTTLHVYPVHTFLMTLPTLGDWNFTANFSVDNLAPQVSVPVNFVSTFNGSYPNRWNWSFGDGAFNNGTNSTISHIYDTGGLKTITLTEYLWQNTSVTNTTIKTDYINVASDTPIANFSSNETTGSIYPLVIQFNDTSTINPQVWNWSFGDGRWFNTTNSLLKNTTYQYAVAGKYNVSLQVNNTIGSNITTKTDYISLTSDNDDNLLVWLHMNGTEGSTVFNGEKGIAWTTMGAAHLTTSTYVFGGSSGNFTGSKSYIYTPSTPLLNFSTGAGEIEMWVKPMSSELGVSLIKRGNSAQTAGWGVVHSTSAIDSSGWIFWMNNDTTGSTNTFTLPIGSWSHLVISADPLGNNKVYVNGTLVATKSGMTENYDTNNPIYIGYRSSPEKYFNGYLDEIRMSKTERWKSNFTPPYDQYAGTPEPTYPDINPNSTFRYKTNPGDAAYIDNITPRNRTIQIQNITNTSYVVGSFTLNSLHGYVKSVQLNLSYYPTGMTLVSSSIDNTVGTVTFNISKPTGFSPGTDRASILDYTLVYYNYTDSPSTIPWQYFGYGFLINSTTGKTYPVHNFLMTLPTLGDWNFTANFSVDSLTPLTGYPVQFVSTFNGSYPNRWNWSFGDGTFNNGTNSTINHAYTTTGLKTVSLTEYIWQNTSITNTTIKTGYINVTELVPVAAFTSSQSGGYPAITVAFTDTSTNFPTSWYWIFGDGNTSILQNPTNSYTFCGNFTVEFRASNYAGFDWENKTDTVVISCTSFRPASTSEKLATKVMDTQNIIVIGVMLIIGAGISVYTITLFTKKSE